MRRKLIGEILVDLGLASNDLIVECLNMQTEMHHAGDRIPLGTLLVRTGHLTMSDLEEALAKQMKYRLPS